MVSRRLVVLFAVCAARCAWAPTPRADPRTRVSTADAVVRSAPAIASAARELGCAADRVRMVDAEDFVQARGCDRMVYFLRSGDGQLRRSGPRFELPLEDHLTEVPAGAAYVPPRWISGTPPSVPPDARWSAWRARARCVLRVNGTLRHCFVATEQPELAD